MENPTSISRVKLRKISVMRLSYIFFFSGVVNGLIAGLFLVLFIQWVITAIGMTSVPPMGGLLFLSFLVIPIVMGILFWIIGLILGLFFNLFLKISRGLDMSYEELD